MAISPERYARARVRGYCPPLFRRLCMVRLAFLAYGSQVCDRHGIYAASLLVGYNSPNGFRFAGRVGTGFSEKLQASIDAKLQKLRRDTCPFINLPEKSRGRWGLGITPEVMKRCQWVDPVLVAQVKFTEWTLDDQLRQPVFLGLRTDKEAKEIVRE